MVLGPIDFYSMDKKKNWNSMEFNGTQNSSVTNILQNTFYRMQTFF